MQDYRLKKSEKKIKSKKVEPKKIAENSSQRRRDWRARLVVTHTTSPLSSLPIVSPTPSPSTSKLTAYNTGAAEIDPCHCPADMNKKTGIITISNRYLG